MSDSVDRILALIDEGLLDAERQHTTEPAMSLDGPPLYGEPRRRTCGDARTITSGDVRLHVCVPECGEDGHVASSWSRFDDGAEFVYVRLHTSEPRTPDTPGETFPSSGNYLAWSVASFVWASERPADESD